MLDAIREHTGEVLGVLSAPAIAAVAALRGARMFHPEGQTFAGTCTAMDGPLGDALAGNVLARLSSALWRRELRHFDVLGLALRFRKGPLGAEAQPGDQDLLTATIRSPLTMPLSPFATDAGDFVGNTYWAVAPFAYDGHRIKLRLRPIAAAASDDGPRRSRLLEAVAQGRARWWLETRPTLRFGWRPVAEIALTEPVYLDQNALRFDPFRGALRPLGLVHSLRRATYAASQWTRSVSSRP